jgi:hypothetical protein
MEEPEFLCTSTEEQKVFFAVILGSEVSPAVQALDDLFEGLDRLHPKFIYFSSFAGFSAATDTAKLPEIVANPQLHNNKWAYTTDEAFFCPSIIQGTCGLPENDPNLMFLESYDYFVIILDTSFEILSHLDFTNVNKVAVLAETGNDLIFTGMYFLALKYF